VGRSVLKGDSDHAIRILMNPAVAESKRKKITGAEFRRQLFKGYPTRTASIAGEAAHMSDASL